MTKTKTSLMAIIMAIAVVGLLAGTASISNSAQAQQQNIPEWIQNIALFWGQGEISESEFVTALEFLGDEGILQLPAAPSAEAQEISASLQELEQRIEQVEERQISPVEPTEPPTTEPEDTTYPTTFAICPADKVRHFDKVQFKLKLDKQVSSTKGHSPISSLHNNIVILEESPDEVGSPFILEDRLAAHLDDLGYSHVVNNNSQPVFAIDIQIIDVEHAVICANKPGIADTTGPLGYK